MSSEKWSTVKLSEIAELTVGFVGTMVEHYEETGITFLRSQNILPYEVDLSDVKHISESFHETLKKSELLVNDVVIVRTGKPGVCAVIPEKRERWNCSDLVIIRPHTEKINPTFLAAYINTLAQGHIRANLVGAVQQHFNVGSAKKMHIPLPPLNEQNEIARYIETLNQKIKLNNRMNKTLEEMAQAIFKSWFVDFEPFQDGEFVDSELGPIPKGWRVGTLGEIAGISTGKRPPSKCEKPDENNRFPVIGASGIMAYTSQALTEEAVITTGRVGTHGIINRYYSPAWVSDNSFMITSNCQEFVYQQLKLLDYPAMNSGSTQPLITQSALKKCRAIIPPEDVLLKYESQVNLFSEKQNLLNLENQRISTIRDTLLPKLMSGEIRVPVEV